MTKLRVEGQRYLCNLSRQLAHFTSTDSLRVRPAARHQECKPTALATAPGSRMIVHDVHSIATSIASPSIPDPSPVAVLRSAPARTCSIAKRACMGGGRLPLIWLRQDRQSDAPGSLSLVDANRIFVQGSLPAMAKIGAEPSAF